MADNEENYYQIINFEKYRYKTTYIKGALYAINEDYFYRLKEDGKVGPLNKLEYKLFCEQLRLRKHIFGSTIKIKKIETKEV